MILLVYCQVVQGGIRLVSSLALDWVSHNLYWLDRVLGTISIASLRTGHRRVLLSETVDHPVQMAVDPREK